MANKYGLVIGINNYPGSENDLSGCINDAMDMKFVLDQRGYQTQALYDQEATLENVVDQLSFMVGNLHYHDTLVVHFSGHGSKVPDANGDEADGFDECLVLYDFENGGLLIDDQIYDLLSERTFGSRVFMLSDSCHSGTVTRMVDLDAAVAGMAKEFGREEKVRYMPPAAFLDGPRLATALQVETKFGLTSNNKPRRGSVLISGCGDAEYSYDAWFGERPNGAFTRAAIDSLNGQQPKNIGEWYKAIRQTLPNAEHPQTPQITASSHQKKWMI